MIFKKCILMLSFSVAMILSVPNFANAEESKNLLDNFSDMEVNNNTKRYDLKGSFTIDRFYLRGTNNSASNGYVSVRLFDSNNRFIWMSIDYRLAYPRPSDRGNTYNETLGTPIPNIRYVEIKGSGRIFDFSVYGKEYIPEITNLKEKVESTKVAFNWENPTNEKVVAVNLYQDKKRIKTFEIKDNVTSYVIEGLEQGKKYNFTFKAVDKGGRETTGVSKNIKIPMPIISPPENVFLTPQDKKMVIAWNDVNSPYLKGYNVYIDGKKINDKPLTSSKMIVKNLENNKSYNVQISAVNKDDIEGEKSKEKSEKPTSNALEVEYDVKIPFTPMDFLKTSLSFLGLIGPFILLALAIIYHKRLIEMIKKSLISYRERRKQ
ncbi:fibronectin type III domain-containing protein [Bacillus cereus group sp. MYBK249-2]|uniref:fibronectin type III domain-containing protein n=2 Tax=unclassified Bacillus cereus group TaxID=2750818 RepID=UPI003F7A7AF5